MPTTAGSDKTRLFGPTRPGAPTAPPYAESNAEPNATNLRVTGVGYTYKPGGANTVLVFKILEYTEP
jgi:hypothetical protein